MDNRMIYIMIGLIVLLAAFVSLIWMIRDWRKQRDLVNGLSYRREHGLFDVMKYMKDMTLSTVSQKQNNSGPSPEAYDKDIPYVNHFAVLDDSKTEMRNAK